jgi:electron transfer flavoprotein alpha subunit
VVLVFVENPSDELSQQAVTFARELGEELHAFVIGASESEATALGAHGVSVTHVAQGPEVYAPASWAQSIVELAGALSPAAVIGPGTDRGNEVLAHVAAKTDLPLAANCVSVSLGEPASVRRVRWGGSLLEEAHLHGSPMLLTVAPHAVSAAGAEAGEATVESFTPTLSAADRLVHVSERAEAASAGVSLVDADVVVSGGRGVGSADGFSVIEELAALLGGAVGCSRAVTSAGWRPHTDQVGQTGSKISPEIYIACGISGATQHMAGCKGAKKLLAINPDGEASIFANADYAVFGDLHEVVPAISAEIRRVRGT